VAPDGAASSTFALGALLASLASIVLRLARMDHQSNKDTPIVFEFNGFWVDGRATCRGADSCDAAVVSCRRKSGVKRVLGARVEVYASFAIASGIALHRSRCQAVDSSPDHAHSAKLLLVADSGEGLMVRFFKDEAHARKLDTILPEGLIP
jgi:hypothetical protein